jgi:hypothetical protein
MMREAVGVVAEPEGKLRLHASTARAPDHRSSAAYCL